jgi:hypothetical protein
MQRNYVAMRHIPGNQNIIADALSRFRVPVNTKWELHPVIFQAITLIWDRPLIDLFATSLNLSREDEAVLHMIIVGDPGTKIVLAKPEL